MNQQQLLFAKNPNEIIQLDEFRDILIRQEETIIFALIERAQFVSNDSVYLQGQESPHFGEFKGKFQHFDGSFLDFLFRETEKLHALVRRYNSPDEKAFYPDCLPKPLLPQHHYSAVIQPNSININPQIMACYLNKIIPQICSSGDDARSYGSTATCDISVLQALSKRIHFGKFIAEAKFQAEPEKFSNLILKKDADGIMAALTNLAVEKKVLQRVCLKASTYGQDIDANGVHAPKQWKVNPQVISDIYRDFVMPLTKQVQVSYLLQRLKHSSVAYVGPKGSSAYSAVMAHYGNENEENYKSVETVQDVFSNVLGHETAYGMVPLQCSNTGMKKETQDLLIANDVNVIAEVVLQEQYLFARQKNDDSSIVKIIAPRSMEQLATEYAEVHCNAPLIVLVDMVEEAAAMVEMGCVAVTTQDAAEAYELEVMSVEVTDISRKCPNSIRFAVISKSEPPTPSGSDKTLLYISVPHQVGQLLETLTVLKKHRVNMTCLESIPCDDPWKYNFFIEINGHANDQSVHGALQDLSQRCVSLRCLGSFPRTKR